MISDIKSVAGSWKLSCQFSDIPSFAKALNGKKTIVMIFKNIFINRVNIENKCVNVTY